MAKSSRASRIKKNNTALKNKIFGPAEQARNERLNDRLLSIASKPTTAEHQSKAKADAMEVERPTDETSMLDDSMQLDADKPDALSKTKQKAQAKSKSSMMKKRRGKPQNQITFNVRPKGKRGARR